MGKTKTTLLSVTHLVLMFVYTVNCDPCTKLESLDVTQGIRFPNDSIIHEGIEYVTGTWYEKELDGIVWLYGCPCIGRTCLWKCCGNGEAFIGRDCNQTDDGSLHPFSPQLFKGNSPVAVQASDHFFFMYGVPCEERYLVDSGNRGNEIFIQENGTLYEISDNRPQWLLPHTYCVDMMLRETPALVAAVCYPDEDDLERDSRVLYIAYSIGLLLSVPFLLATFLVYAFIPELRNLHGLCLMAYCAGLIVAYLFLSYLKLHTGQINVAMTGCLVVAFIVYYAFQSSFFWLNVMCFDIWRTFSGHRRGSTKKKHDRRRFAMYAAYAWGVPLILIGITLTMQMVDDLPAHIVRPRLGDRRCWFENWLSELVYFYVPVLILVVCNTVLFAVTATRIRSIRQETAILKGSESARNDRLKKDKQRFGLYLKLFIVMGVNWIIELISFAVGGSNIYWVVMDLSNLSLGIFIFVISVWNNKVRNLVIKRFRSARGVRSGTDLNGTGRWATSSSGPTEDTRLSTEENTVRMREMR